MRTAEPDGSAPAVITRSKCHLRTSGDDGKHSQSPSPALDRVGKVDDDVGADPGVDKVRRGWDQRGEHSSSERGQIGDNDLNDDAVDGVTDLVEDDTSAVVRDALGRALDDGTDDIEGQTGDEQLDSAKDVGQLGGNRLTGGTDDTLQDTHGGEQRVRAVRAGSVALEGVSDGLTHLVIDSGSHAVHGNFATHPIDTHSVGEEEDTEESEGSGQPAQLGADSLDPLDTCAGHQSA